MPKVSVIIPVYNVEKYLRECLDSVINQALKDIEIICVDDGSPDNSLSILKEYANKDKRFVLIEQNNKGVATARNNAIDKATGEFVCFMDPDDYYPDDKVLETLYSKAVENNVYICGGEFSAFIDGETNITQNYGNTSDGYLFDVDGIVKYTDYQFDYGFTRFIYNRKFLNENSIKFPCYTRFEDPVFFVKAMFKAKKFYAVDRIVYCYRTHHKVTKWTKQNIYDLLDAIYINFTFAKEHNLKKLSDYTFARFCTHYPRINKNIDKNAKLKIKKCIKIEPRIKNYLMQCKINLLKNFIKAIFSIRNDKDKKHKVITILGIKIKFKRRNNGK